MSSCHTIPYFTCKQWSACAALCIIPAGSPFLSRESLDPAKCFLHLWMQLWATGCTVPNTVCWHRLELYSARVFFFFSFLHVNISVNLSVCFLAVVSLGKKEKKRELLWPTKHGNRSLSERLEVVPPKSCFQVFYWPPSRAQKMPQLHSVWGTQLRYRLDYTLSLS